MHSVPREEVTPESSISSEAVMRGSQNAPRDSAPGAMRRRAITDETQPPTRRRAKVVLGRAVFTLAFP